MLDFPGYTTWNWFIGFKPGTLCAEELKKEVKCDFETEREQDFRDIDLLGLCNL